MKQKLKRALWMLMCLMAMVSANAQTIVTVDGLQYSLSGAYATVYSVATGNTSRKITVPATIVYEGMTYTINEIGRSAFCYDSSSDYSSSPYHSNRYVKEVILPNTIKTINDGAFINSNITNVQLAEGVKSIGNEAFQGASIISIVIPSTVTSMVCQHGWSIFRGCNKLRTIVYLGATPPYGWTATSNTYVPSKKAYSTPSYSINNANIIEMISFSDDTFTYTGEAPNVTWTNNVEGYTAKMTMPTLSPEVGTHEVLIPMTFTKDEESFDVQIPYSYTIQPVMLKAKVSDVSRLYGEENPQFSISYTGFVNNETESVITTMPIATTTAKTGSKIGSYPITLKGGQAKNYTFEYEHGTLTVNKAPLIINVEDLTKVYGQENPTFSLNYVGLKNNETKPTWSTAPTFTTEATKMSDVGTYTVNVTCEPQNYQATINSGTLNVTQAPLTIKAENASRPYGGRDPEFTYSCSGFMNGDTQDVLTKKPTIQTEATIKSNVGDYTIIPTDAQAQNYNISYVEGALSITQVPLTVRAVSCTRDYGKENPTFSFIYEGFVNDETEDVLLSLPTASTSANINSKVGTYDIRVSGGRAFNYKLNYESGQLTINPVPLTISVDNYERPYNQENPTFSCVYEGFVANDTEASLQTKPMVRTTATKTSDVGTYPLEVSGAYSPNYTITYQSGTLTIEKAEQTLEWEQDLSSLLVNDEVELKAVASSGLPVTYIMDDISGAELYPAGKKTYLECKEPCEFVIKAVQNGNSNYYATQRITKKVKISNEEDTGIGDIESEEPTDIPQNDLHGIYTLTGTKVSDDVSDLKTLPQGVYIVNGKKIIVK